MSESLRAILERQREWARSSGLHIDAMDYTERLEDNLFQPLHPDTRRDFAEGAGDELGGDGRPGKL